jgi:hypothetical protein
MGVPLGGEGVWLEAFPSLKALHSFIHKCLRKKNIAFLIKRFCFFPTEMLEIFKSKT